MWHSFLQTLSFQAGYNTTLVLSSTITLGMACGVIGSFIYLRKRAMLSDTVSHATLPGVALGFMVAVMFDLNDGRHLPTLLAGAALTALLGGLCVQWIKINTRLNEDVAIGSVLSVFYGGGIVLLSVIQRMETGSKAGLETFLLGQVSGLTQNESWTIMIAAIVVVIAALLLFKELTLICFDSLYARSTGQPLLKLDITLLALMIIVVCIGLKTVGLVLIVALLITPAATARFWTDNITSLIVLASIFGALSCYIGAALSATLPNLPTGGVIVLSAASFFTLSFILAPKRGLFSSLLGARHA
ncbi:MAG: hypothetical protein DHS20C02_05400 [Micavibrio sp.]|nr:MAG: hypothetical protein DHS20C02_05400 [Micavibrio sp.]